MAPARVEHLMLTALEDAWRRVELIERRITSWERRLAAYEARLSDLPSSPPTTLPARTATVEAMIDRLEERRFEERRGSQDSRVTG